jgi:hypothetical protein
MNKRLNGYTKIDHFIDAINSNNPTAIKHLFKD